MPILDIFSGDAFSQSSLVAAINAPTEGQAVPNPIDGLFVDEGIPTNSVAIEMQDNSLTLVPATAYGAPGDATNIGKRQFKKFELVHLVTDGAVYAHEVQGVRAFGEENGSEAFEIRVNTVLSKMRRRLEATRRYQRIKSLQGRILDADGTTVIVDLFAEFGVTQQTQSFSLGTATTKIKNILESAKDASADAVGDSAMIVGWNMYCGRSFFRDFVGHDKVESAFDRYTGGAFLAESQSARAFQFSDINIYKIHGRVGSVDFIPETEAYLVPILDNPDAYITRYGPADYSDFSNTIGLPFYSSSERMPHNKGVMLEAQSNTISMPTLPRSIIKCTA